MISPNPGGFSFSQVTEAEVILAIDSIKLDTVGLDGIPMKFIKMILPAILASITYIFNLIISTSHYPIAWKASKILPIRKKPNKGGELDNLRPISILSALSKAFEKLVKGQIQNHLDSNNLLSQFQSGFRAAHSTTTALLKVHDDIASVVDKRGAAFLLLIDFSKAFDRVSHSKLLTKLSRQFNFTRGGVDLIRSYLSSRTQTVCMNGRYSEQQMVVSGVPQGSVLGPLLFSMFINDLPENIQSCKIHLFADDVELYFSSHTQSLPNMARLINMDLASVYRWSQQNLMPINTTKTKVLLVSRSSTTIDRPTIIFGGETLEYVSKACVLGVVLQNDFEWDSHVNVQCAKIYAGLRSLRSSCCMLSARIKIMLFKSLLMPHFTYGCEFLLSASAGSISRLRIALNCCVRWIFNLGRYAHVTHLQQQLLGCSFNQFHKYRACLLLFKIIQFEKPQYLHEKLIQCRSSRTRNMIIPAHNTSHYGSTLFVRGIATWNQLPNQLKNLCSYTKFREESINWFNGRS